MEKGQKAENSPAPPLARVKIECIAPTHKKIKIN